ncbi:tyrosine-protein phosphatase non-receptor type 9-like [Cydia pomonella]|uniref:tyrosine-protein phosphatase non-receptor type 9-like n=1 Tax=Cydia pomonella TaxID=82600 RepID=UPI002ADD53C7|nr:tyrosine-protein phosphatase non-receptor type 9-like [Cydia pomonella]
MAYKDLYLEDFVSLMGNSDWEQQVTAEHKRITSEKVEGTFEESSRNRDLNRFVHDVCYDHSRVVLPTERNRNTFINANYCDGADQQKQYVLAEAPTQKTAYNFYRLIWMHHVKIVVMLCQKVENKKEKCYPYWSDVPLSSMSFNKKFRVTTMKVERFAHYVKSTLLLTDGTDACQVVTHYNYTAWPDHGVPENTLDFLKFVLEVRRFRESLPGDLTLPQPPMVVHCNAGLGRTPCFVVIDTCISKLKSDKKVAIASTLVHIRQQRFYSLFQTSQYIFVYKVIKLYVDSIPRERKISPAAKAIYFLRDLVK